MANIIPGSAAERFLTTPDQLPSAHPGDAWFTPAGDPDPRSDEPELTRTQKVAHVADGFGMAVAAFLMGGVGGLALRILGAA